MAFAAQDTQNKTFTRTVGTQTLTSTTDTGPCNSGAPCSHQIDWSGSNQHRLGSSGLTDENLNFHGPPLAVPDFVSPAPKYRPNTKPEPAVLVSVTESPEERDKRKDSPLVLSAALVRPTPPRDRKGGNGGIDQQEGQGVDTNHGGALSR